MKRDKLVKAAAFILVVLGVWFIAEVNIIGQYCMLAAQQKKNIVMGSRELEDRL